MDDERHLLGSVSDDEEIEESKSLRKTPSAEIRKLFSNTRRKRNLNQSEASLSIFQNKEEHENIIAAFVVTFDTRSGNLLEWSEPEDFELEGVEFKSMPSGAHTVASDFVYFRLGHYFGLSCYEKMAVASSLERGVRMKSVGIVSSSYASLHKHMSFLENQVRLQLENPGVYESLIEFFHEKKAVLDTSSLLDTDTVLVNIGDAINHEPIIKQDQDNMTNLPTMTITHPAGCFSQFFRFFGKSIFSLWRSSLLHKRIIFFSPPPVGVICYRVYCACALSRHNISTHLKSVRPYFYVNIADIDSLDAEMHYIACTTEKIFEDKTLLYDVYVDQQTVKTNDLVLKDIIKVNKCDDEKYHQLINLRQEFMYLKQFGECEYDSEEEMFIGYFMELNNRIFQTLSDLVREGDGVLNPEHMRVMGLDPKQDVKFIQELLKLHDMNITMVVDNPCCPL